MKGLKIDYDPLVNGVIQLIDDLCERDESYFGALVYGMLPAPIMDYLEKDFKRKVYELFAEQQGFTVEDGNAHFKEIFDIEEYYKLDPAIVSEFMHTISVKLLRHYKEKGIIIV